MYFLSESPTKSSTSTQPITAPTTTANDIQKYLDEDKTLLGKFENPLHGVSGVAYSIGSDKLLIQDFSYDGRGPDAFFWVGTEGTNTHR